MLPKVNISALTELNSTMDMIKQLEQYKAKNSAIGLNGDTFQPDGFLTFFRNRGLPFKFYVNNKGVSIGSRSAYDENIAILHQYLTNNANSERTSCEATIRELEMYKSNNWAIGLNGDTLQPDGFNTFFAARSLTFKPYVRSTSGVSIGQRSAYDANAKTLKRYMEQVSVVLEEMAA